MKPSFAILVEQRIVVMFGMCDYDYCLSNYYWQSFFLSSHHRSQELHKQLETLFHSSSSIYKQSYRWHWLQCIRRQISFIDLWSRFHKKAWLVFKMDAGPLGEGRGGISFANLVYSCINVMGGIIKCAPSFLKHFLDPLLHPSIHNYFNMSKYHICLSLSLYLHERSLERANIWVTSERPMQWLVVLNRETAVCKGPLFVK